MAGNIYNLVDARTAPDPIHPYTSDLTDVPIVIDNGAYQCRVGWETDTDPRLVFRNFCAKHRKDRGKKAVAAAAAAAASTGAGTAVSSVETELLVGNDISNVEAVRFQLRTAHDDNIVTHFQAQELMLNYTFSHLGLTGGNVPHPVVMTEALLNPNYCRALMSELLFECYGVPKVAYCVDSLASYHHNCRPTAAPVTVDGTPQARPSAASFTALTVPEDMPDGLIICIGQHTTHVVPVLDGHADVVRTRRMKLGGHNLTKFLWRWLQLKYPHHATAITLSRAEELVHGSVRVSSEFWDELSKWSCPEVCREQCLRVQMPYAAPTAAPADPAAQRERRREAARRLVLINARKREEKLLSDEAELERLLSVGPDPSLELDDEQLSTPEEVARRVAALQARISKTRAKMEAGDDALEDREKESSGNAGSSAATAAAAAAPTDPIAAAAWLEGLQKEWGGLRQRRAARRNKRQEMAKRRTAASQERMRIISQLARREKKDDNFGRRDEDWDVYKAINKDGGGSDSEEESERLQELEGLLKQHSPAFLAADAANAAPPLTLAENYQLQLTTELIRTAEVLFQPSMLGLDQGGLGDTLEYVLRLFPTAAQQRLASNVLVTGGPAALPGLIERLRVEMRAIRPFQSHFSITRAKDPSLDAWRGCRAAAAELLQEAAITRADYEEHGGERIPYHFLGNKYWASIAPTLTDEQQQQQQQQQLAEQQEQQQLEQQLLGEHEAAQQCDQQDEQELLEQNDQQSEQQAGTAAAQDRLGGTSAVTPS